MRVIYRRLFRSRSIIYFFNSKKSIKSGQKCKTKCKYCLNTEYCLTLKKFDYCLYKKSFDDAVKPLFSVS